MLLTPNKAKHTMYPTSNKKFIKKKSRQLLIPYLFTASIVAILFFAKSTLKSIYLKKFSIILLCKNITSNALMILYGSGLNTEFFGFKINYIGAIWFLLALFWSLLIMNFISNKKYNFLIVIILFLIGYFSSMYTWFPFSIQAGFLGLLFLYFGYCLSKYNIFKKILSLNYKNSFIWGLLFLIWSLGICFNIIIDVCRCYCTNLLLSVAVSVSGSMCILLISKYIEKFNNFSIFNLLICIGRDSLFIMCIHLLEQVTFFRLIRKISSFTNPYLYLMIAIIYKIVIILLMYKIARNNKIITKIFPRKADDLSEQKKRC